MPRQRNLFDPESDKPYKLSRSRLENFKKCPRCFYIDRRLGVDRPPGFPFNLNSAVDTLLKREFDQHRADGTPHPYMIEAGIDAIPAQHPMLNVWRENFKGVQYHHEPTNLIITGAIDDLWLGGDGRHIVVDYKATSKNGEVNLNADWQIGYKRQMEIYQWLLRHNGLDVDPTGWFVYCNGRRDTAGFDNHLEFSVKLLPYTGDDAWVDGVVSGAHQTLCADEIPDAADDCEYCAYRSDALHVEAARR